MSLLLRLVLYLLPLLAVVYLYMSTEILSLIQLSNKLLKQLLDHLVDWVADHFLLGPMILVAVVAVVVLYFQRKRRRDYHSDLDDYYE